MSNSIAPLVTIENNVALADSRQIARQLDIDHNDFFNNLIKKYEDEVSKDFGLIRFQNVKTTSDQQGRGRHSSYALLTEDQTYVYLAYSKNTEQARRCKRLLVKAFSEARTQLATATTTTQGLTAREAHLVGLASRMIDLVEMEIRLRETRSLLLDEFIAEAQEVIALKEPVFTRQSLLSRSRQKR